MRVPSKAKRGSKTGIFVSLHGSGGSGPGTERHFGMPDSKLICVYPTVTNQRGGWSRPEGERFVLAIIDELKRTYTIDTNRIFVAGHSMGGFGSWHIGGTIFQWMLKHTRNPRPDRVVWEPSLAWKRHFYWLRSEGGNGIIDVQRKGNTFTVSGGDGDLSIELDAKICDLKKPVIVKLVEDGQVSEFFNGVPKLSLRVLVESIGVRNDPEMTYVARVPVR